MMIVDNSKSEQAVVFLHIPRTAGTTLHHIIERQYRSEQLYSSGMVKGEWVEELEKLSEARRAQIRMFRGHMGFGVHRLLPGPSTYMTILREPVERVISYYHFIRRAPHHYLHDFIKSEDLNLKAFIENKAHVMIDNAQTRIVSGVWHEPKFGECTQEMLETAKRNLRENFTVVGLTEKFDETLLLLKRAFGWRNLFHARQNVTLDRPRQDELSPDTLNAIVKANQLDIDLYRYATTLFEEQVRQQGPLFTIEVKTFQLVNQLFNLLIWGYWQARKVSVRVLVRKWIDRIFSRVNSVAKS